MAGKGNSNTYSFTRILSTCHTTPLGHYRHKIFENPNSTASCYPKYTTSVPISVLLRLSPKFLSFTSFPVLLRSTYILFHLPRPLFPPSVRIL
jgi:hypothetical protein